MPIQVMSLKQEESTERNPLLLAVKQGDVKLAQKYLNEEGASNVNYIIERKVRWQIIIV